MGRSNIYRNLPSGITQPFKIYRGEVVAVNTNESEDEVRPRRRTILIKEYGGIDEPPYIEALPPSPIPIDSTGSGMFSIPVPGTQCLVIEGGLHNTHMTRAQILSYLPSRAVSSEGMMTSVEDISDGDFYMKIGGILKSTFKMTKVGQIQLFSGQFAMFDLNGDLKRIEQQSKRYLRKNSIGLYLNEWVEPQLENPLVYERTSHTSSFTLSPESPMDSDAKLDTEEAAVVPLLRPFVNKAVIRAGKIPNKKQLLQDSSTHPYTIDTRNSTGLNPFQKDTITKLEIGFQGGHYPYGASLFHRAPGNMIHWTAKRNTVGNVGTFLWRYGKLETHSGTKAPMAPPISAAPEEDLSGEVWRRQIYQGLNFDAVPLGIPVINPLGEGEGYKEGDAGNALQNYTESYGKLDGISPTMIADPARASLWRRDMHDQLVANMGFYVEERYGGQGATMGVEPDYYIRNISTMMGAPNDTWTERYGKSMALGGYNYKLELKDGITQASSTVSYSPLEMKFENNFIPATSKNSLVFDNMGQSITLMHQLAAFMGAIEITGTTITLNSNNGLGQIKIDTTNPATPDITLTAGALNVNINPSSGLQVGGKSMAMAALVDWILSNASAFGIGNMGAPVPIFPGAIATLGTQANMTAGTVMGGVISGFKSGT